MSFLGLSGLNTTGSITQGTPSMNLQLELRNQQQQQQQQPQQQQQQQLQQQDDASKMDTSLYSQQLQPNYIPNQQNYVHQTTMGHHMHHILNLHNHRSLTNSPISNPGSPGLDMIQEELPNVQSSSKSDQQVVGHPQISVTDVLGNFTFQIIYLNFYSVLILNVLFF